VGGETERQKRKFSLTFGGGASSDLGANISKKARYHIDGTQIHTNDNASSHHASSAGVRRESFTGRIVRRLSDLFCSGQNHHEQKTVDVPPTIDRSTNSTPASSSGDESSHQPDSSIQQHFSPKTTDARFDLLLEAASRRKSFTGTTTNTTETAATVDGFATKQKEMVDAALAYLLEANNDPRLKDLRATIAQEISKSKYSNEFVRAHTSIKKRESLRTATALAVVPCRKVNSMTHKEDQPSFSVPASQDTEEQLVLKANIEGSVPKKNPNGRARKFPEKLMDAIEADQTDSIQWLPDEKGFIVTDTEVFEKEVLFKFFKESKYSSFTRKLNRWGFRRMIEYTGAYYHKDFVKGDYERLKAVKCSNSDNSSPMQVLATFGSAIGSSTVDYNDRLMEKAPCSQEDTATSTRLQPVPGIRYGIRRHSGDKIHYPVASQRQASTSHHHHYSASQPRYGVDPAFSATATAHTHAPSAASSQVVTNQGPIPTGTTNHHQQQYYVGGEECSKHHKYHGQQQHLSRLPGNAAAMAMLTNNIGESYPPRNQVDTSALSLRTHQATSSTREYLKQMREKLLREHQYLGKVSDTDRQLYLPSSAAQYVNHRNNTQHHDRPRSSYTNVHGFAV